MDPFTGHETQGIWPLEYQKIFLAKAFELYKPFIDDYNQLLLDLDIQRRAQEYIISISNSLSEKELIQFSKDVFKELSPIDF